MTVEIDNVREEIREILEKCMRCGLCKSLCPVIKVLREEQYSPRGRVIMFENNFIEKIIYDCTLCKACEVQCPMNLKLCNAFIKARTILVSQNKEFSKNIEIIKNLNKTGNIFGIKEEKD
jgi:Fe-S oxidoreductase